MNDRELARVSDDEDAWLRETLEAIDTPEHRAAEVTWWHALCDERERITREIIAQMLTSEDDE